MGYCAQGGRIVAHHLEFDGGLIAQELARVRLHQYNLEWEKALRKGVCTMAPDIACWRFRGIFL